MSWKKDLQQSGFAIIPDLFDRGELAALISGIDGVHRSRAGIRHLLGEKTVVALANEPRLLGIARQPLGEDAVPFRATLFDKSPDSNWLVVWHQDTALPLHLRKDIPGWGPWSVKAGIHYAHAPASALEKILALRVHLDDSTAQNGPLRVLPGTHRMGLLSDDRISELATTIHAVDCTVESGGILAMRPLIVHSSSKLSAELRRRVLHIEYATSPFISDELELALA
jgi:ectoine hydroxylase-related dioxygenase (phytanoyl-CoA dioxygenase family)